jgi:hypothetical protein
MEITNRARTLLTWHVQRTASLQQELMNAGSLKVGNFDQPGELEARLALIERLRASLQEAVTAGDAAYAAVPGELARAGVFRQMRAQSLAEFQREMDWPAQSEALKAAIPMYDAAIALFRHLAETKGTWSVTPGANNIEFNTPEAKQRGDALRDALVRASQQLIARPKSRPAAAATTTPASVPSPRD